MDTSRLRTPSGARLNGGTPKASRSPSRRRQKNLESREKFQEVLEFFLLQGRVLVNPLRPCSCAPPSLARAAARLPAAPFPCPSGHLRPAISSRERPLPVGWPRLASHAPAQVFPAPPAPCRRPPGGV